MKNLKVNILLIGGEIPGGAERRIASFLQNVDVLSEIHLTLIVNSELLAQLKISGLEPTCRVVELRSWYYENLFNKLLYTSPKNIIYKLLKKLFKLTSNFFLFLQLGFYLLFNKTDVFHLVLGGARTLAFPFLPFIDSAIVCSVVGTEIRAFNKMWLVDQYILQKYLKKCHVVDALSEELYDLLIEKRLTEKDKIKVSGSFVDTNKNHPSLEKKSWVAFAARFVDGKNVFLFLNAIPEILSRTNNQIIFFMLGDGKLAPQIKNWIYENGLEKNVIVEFRNQISDILSESMIFCSLQEHENYPSRSLLEAMSCGNAIVATDVGYTYKLVNELTGIRVKPSPKDVALAVSSLIKDVDKTIKIGRQARQLILNHYSPEIYCQKMEEIYWHAYNIKK